MTDHFEMHQILTSAQLLHLISIASTSYVTALPKLVDLGNNIDLSKLYLESYKSLLSDEAAISSDWSIISNELSTIIKNYEPISRGENFDHRKLIQAGT